MKKTFSGILVAALALAGVLGTSTKADAAFFAAICNDVTCTGGDDFLFQDNTGADASSTQGAIILATSLYGYSFLVNTSQSKPLIGSPAAPQMDLNYTVTLAPGAVATSPNVFLYASDTDFTSTGAHGFTIALGGTNSDAGTVTGRAWGGTSNTAFDRTNLFATSGPFATASYNQTFSGTYNAAVTPYSLTLGVQVANLSSNGTATGDLNLKVPEPATMTLFGLGLMGFGVASRRRKAAQAK